MTEDKPITTFDEDLSFIENALNCYWHDAYNNLQRKDLGDIEKENYEFQLRRSKELMQKIDRGEWQSQQTVSKKEQYIILALIRCVLATNPKDATSHQIMRLYKSYVESGNKEIANSLHELLNPDSNECCEFKIVQSQQKETKPTGFDDAFYKEIEKQCQNDLAACQLLRIKETEETKPVEDKQAKNIIEDALPIVLAFASIQTHGVLNIHPQHQKLIDRMNEYLSTTKKPVSEEGVISVEEFEKELNEKLDNKQITNK